MKLEVSMMIHSNYGSNLHSEPDHMYKFCFIRPKLWTLACKVTNTQMDRAEFITSVQLCKPHSNRSLCSMSSITSRQRSSSGICRAIIRTVNNKYITYYCDTNSIYWKYYHYATHGRLDIMV